MNNAIINALLTTQRGSFSSMSGSSFFDLDALKVEDTQSSQFAMAEMKEASKVSTCSPVTAHAISFESYLSDDGTCSH